MKLSARFLFLLNALILPFASTLYANEEVVGADVEVLDTLTGQKDSLPIVANSYLVCEKFDRLNGYKNPVLIINLNQDGQRQLGIYVEEFNQDLSQGPITIDVTTTRHSNNGAYLADVPSQMIYTPNRIVENGPLGICRINLELNAGILRGAASCSHVVGSLATEPTQIEPTFKVNASFTCPFAAG